MQRVSARMRLGVVTLGLFVAVGALVFAIQQARPLGASDLREIVDGSIAAGSRVTVIGMVVYSGPGRLVLVPEGAHEPRLNVSMADGFRAKFGSRVTVGVRGLVTDSGGLSEATLLFPTGPSKFESANATR